MMKAIATITIQDITRHPGTKAATITATMDIKRQTRHTRTNKDRSSDKPITRVLGRGVLGMIRTSAARLGEGQNGSGWMTDEFIRLGAFNNAL